MPFSTLVKASTDPRAVRDNDVAVASSNDELRLASLYDGLDYLFLPNPTTPT